MLRRKYALIILCLVPVLFGLYLLVQQWIGNFHVVLQGELYRSAQPQSEKLSELSQKHGIKTIINLRDDISQAELSRQRAAAQLSSIHYIHFPMSSARILPDKKIEKLVSIMRQVPKPLLIHCDHGANRTGLASALYLAEISKKNEWTSEFQLSPYYGHIPIRGIGRYSMYKTWDDYEERLGF